MVLAWPDTEASSDMPRLASPTAQRNAGRIVLAVGSCLLSAPHGALAQELSERRVQITLATPELIHKASIGVGQPVVVSRADLESPFVRIRSIEEDVSARLPAGTADPAFKAVLLTPRASTGRPVQPQMANLGVPEDAEIDPPPSSKPEPASASGAQKSATGAPPASVKKPPPPASRSQQKSARPPAPAPSRTAIARPAQKSAAVAPQASAPRYGAAEIQAVRAFARF
jgi:hypothetical protein